MKRSLNPYQNEFSNPFDRNIVFAELLLIVAISCIPMLISFPYHINLFLSWEGAYRLYLGQIPYKDFGMPVGYGYWLIPALFFRIFGPTLFTLIYAQAFINLISALAFRSMLRTLMVSPGIRLVSILLYLISFSFYNFLPWYNHSNIVFEFIGLAFLLKFIFRPDSPRRLLLMALATFFLVLSVFTKQDGGAMGIGLAIALLIGNLVYEQRFLNLGIFAAFLIFFLALFTGPFIPYHIGYWFNHGQAPHSSRLSLPEILETFLQGSQFIKFYLLLVIVLAIVSARKSRRFFTEQRELIFLLLTLGILGEASIYQVTSYTPVDMEIFFHSFALVYILSHLDLDSEFRRPGIVVVTAMLVMIWWSGTYYRSFNHYLTLIMPKADATEFNYTSRTGRSDGIHENVINRHTYILKPEDSLYKADTSRWIFSKTMPSFRKVYLPALTVAGMDRIAALKVLAHHENVTVLNMTELTPLERDLHFKLETGSDIPLWYHLGVGMFQKQTNEYAAKIKRNYYPLVLFENVENLNNFYPFRLRDTLNKYYVKIFEFSAPRKPVFGSTIEVYEPKSGPDAVAVKPALLPPTVPALPAKTAPVPALPATAVIGTR